MHPIEIVRIAALLAVAALSAARPAAGDIVEIAPFVGQVRDNLSGYTQTFIIDDQITVLGGALTVRSHDGSTLVHLISGSTFGGDHVAPRSPAYMIGVTEGPAIWQFNTPARRIGAWWDTNSGADDAQAQFFDAAGALLGADVLTIPRSLQGWTWNGWESTGSPIARMVITGNGALDGFFWTDDLEFTPIPEPGAGMMLLAAALLARCARWRRKDDAR